MRRVHVRATGRVQGVFFRASARDEARRLGITGWVRNTRDGAVEAEAQGAPDAVEQFLSFCRAGPGAARVEALDIAELEPQPAEQGFTVT